MTYDRSVSDQLSHTAPLTFSHLKKKTTTGSSKDEITFCRCDEKVSQEFFLVDVREEIQQTLLSLISEV